MDAEILYFFSEHMDALPLYQRLEALILEQIPDVRIKASKTQIGFSTSGASPSCPSIPAAGQRTAPKPG